MVQLRALGFSLALILVTALLYGCGKTATEATSPSRTTPRTAPAATSPAPSPTPAATTPAPITPAAAPIPPYKPGSNPMETYRKARERSVGIPNPNATAPATPPTGQ